MAGRKFASGGIMFPINRQTQIKTSRLPTVTKCDTRFRNNAKFASFDVFYSQREFRVVPKKLSTVSFTVVSRVVPVFAREEKKRRYFCPVICSQLKNFSFHQLRRSLESERFNRARCIHILIYEFYQFAQNT